MIRTIAKILPILLLFSCRPQVPDKYIQPGEMEDLLYDYHLSQGVASTLADEGDGNGDYKRRLYFLAVLKKYGVSEAEFDSSMVYYYSHADRMAEIYKSLEERLDADAQKIGASGGTHTVMLSANGDTANVWNGVRSKVLCAVPLHNRMDFHIVADTSYHANDMLQLNFRSSFLYQEGMKDAVALIAVKYEGDTIVSRYQRVMSSGETRLTINEKNDKKIKEINGFIYLSKGGRDDAKTLKLLVIDQIQLVRMRQKAEPQQSGGVKSGGLRSDSLKRDSAKVVSAPATVGGSDKPTHLLIDEPRKNVPAGGPRRMLQKQDLQPVRSGN